MLLYSVVGILFCSLLGLSYLLLDTVKLKINQANLEKSLSDYLIENEQLKTEKIDSIRQIERLKEKIIYQEQLIEQASKLQKESSENTRAVLFDLGSRLSKDLIDLHKKENNEIRQLSERNIEATTGKFNKEFERISNMVSALNKDVTQSKDTVDIIKNSLLSPSGAGSLAEITLENILKSSGLQNNLDFYLQYNVAGETDNSSLRPDAVIFLPDDRLMIVDSKASKFLVDQNSNPDQLAKTMNSHLKSLSSKNYADSVKKHLKDKNNKLVNIVTLMFVPSEHAVEKIMEADSEFLNKAWQHNIFPVGPAGLMNMLSFAKFQISEQKMNQHNLQIIDEVKQLIASISIMTEHSIKLGNSISNAVNHYDKFAASFNRNFLSKAKKLNVMGVENSLKKNQEPLKRLQIFTSNSDLIEVEAEETRKLEEIVS